MPALLGIAHHLPADQAVGALRRPIATDPVGPSDLAVEPARRAMQQAGLEVADTQFIIFATQTPDVTFPGSACYFQHKFGCDTVGALDVRGQCAGFLMGLMTADSFLRAGVYAHVLLAAGEVQSPGLDYSEPGAATASLYGDGAAVAILGADGSGLEAVVCHSDGRHHEQFWIQYPSSRQHPVRITAENLRSGGQYPQLDRPALEAFADRHLPDVVREALAAAGQGAGAVDCFIISHILPGVAARSATALGLADGRWIDAGAAHGHLGAATLPVALSEAMAAGRLGRGARVCLATCGAGFAWGAAVVTL
ncbi:MAG: 3-oxoacyl-ACP synthase III family protein [Candidatus Binatia bacterium]